MANNIKLSQPKLDQTEIDGVIEVIKSGMIAQGPVTKIFEEKFAEEAGTKYALALSNGTVALHAALIAMGITEGDEVITTPFTFVATANSIMMQRARPVFVDINERDYCIDNSKIEKNITPKTKAILPVDLYGQAADYRKLSEISAKYKLGILEDACQAIGATQNGKKAGSLGDIAAFSLYATKNITTGEGGMITTDNQELFEKIKRIRHHGQDESRRYEYLEMGYNYRITDIQSAIGVAQLRKLSEITTKRISNAHLYDESLRNIEGIVLPYVAPGNTHVYHQYTIRVTEEFPISREELVSKLIADGVPTGIYYPKPLHLHEHFRKLGYSEGDFPVSELVSKQVISLPIHPMLTDGDINFIGKTIKKYAKK